MVQTSCTTCGNETPWKIGYSPFQLVISPDVFHHHERCITKQKNRSTRQKSNIIDTKNGHFFGVTYLFQGPAFWGIQPLLFGDVPKTIQAVQRSSNHLAKHHETLVLSLGTKHSDVTWEGRFPTKHRMWMWMRKVVFSNTYIIYNYIYKSILLWSSKYVFVCLLVGFSVGKANILHTKGRSRYRYCDWIEGFEWKGIDSDICIHSV